MTSEPTERPREVPGRIPGFLLGIVALLCIYTPGVGLLFAVPGLILSLRAVRRMPPGTPGRGLPLIGAATSFLGGVGTFTLGVLVLIAPRVA